jgi:hypothetical protein
MPLHSDLLQAKPPLKIQLFHSLFISSMSGFTSLSLPIIEVVCFYSEHVGTILTEDPSFFIIWGFPRIPHMTY